MQWIRWITILGYLLVIISGYPQSDNNTNELDNELLVTATDGPQSVTESGGKINKIIVAEGSELPSSEYGRGKKYSVHYRPVTKSPLRRRTQKSPRIKKKKIVKTEEINSDYEEPPGGTFSPTSFENKLPFDGKETEEDDSEDETDSEEGENDSQEEDEDDGDFFYDEIEPVFSAFTPRPPRRPYTLEYDSKEDDYDDDYYEDDYSSNKDDGDEQEMSFTSFLMDLFYEVFARFTGTGGSSSKHEEDYYDEHNYAARRTTPRMWASRKPKRPSYGQFLGFYNQEEAENRIDSSNEERPKEEVAESKWLSWFDSPELETTVPTVSRIESSTVPMTTPPTTSTENSWGIFNIFNNPNSKKSATTKRSKEVTTAAPSSSANPLPALISALTDHLGTSTIRPLTDEPPISPPTIQKSYKNYQLWRLKPINEDQLTALNSVRKYKMDYQWWQGPTLEGKTDVLVPPKKVDEFREFLDEEEIKYTTTIRDLQMAIKYSNPQIPRSESFQLEAIQGHPLTWHRYHRYADIVKYLEYLHRKFPANVNLIHIGRSFEGRPIIVCHIFERRPTKKMKTKKQSIFIEGGMRGQEWIAPAVATWIIEDLARNNFRLTNKTLDGVLLSREWYILPVANPDGYEYTHTTDRLWTKNRARKRKTSIGFFSNFFSLAWFTRGNADQEDLKLDEDCLGVDLNRNFDYRWNRINDNFNGRSSCSNDYAGTRPFSEAETRSLTRFLIKIAPTLKLYVSLQAYGQFISLPKTKLLPLERFELMESAENAANSLRKFGLPLVKYFVDEDASLRDSVSGNSDGFVSRELQISRVFTIKLRDTGENGFLLPPSYIETTAREAFEMIKILVDDLRRKVI